MNLSEFVFLDLANFFPNLHQLQGIYFRIINLMSFAWKEVRRGVFLCVVEEIPGMFSVLHHVH